MSENAPYHHCHASFVVGVVTGVLASGFCVLVAVLGRVL